MNDPIFQKFDQVLGTKTPQAGMPVNSRADEIRALAKKTQQPTPIPEPTGGEGFVQGLAKPFLRAGVTATKAVGGLGGIALGGIGKLTGREDIKQAGLNMLKASASTEPVSFGKTPSGAEHLVSPITTAKEAVGTGAEIGATIGSLGMKAPVTALGKVLGGSGLGATFGGASAMSSNKGTGDILKSAGIGAAIGGAIPAGIEAVKWAVRGVPKLLSYTSGVPEEVMQRNFDNPSAMKGATNAIKSGGVSGARQTGQGAVKTLRTNLSQQWDEGVQGLISSNNNIRTGLSSNETKLLSKIVDKYGIETPQNLKNMGVNETLNLNKVINELYKKVDVKQGSGGIIVRQFKDLLDNHVSKFTGAKEFLKNYSIEKQVLDAADDILKSWGKKPTTMATVESKLLNAWKENKTAVISALKDLEAKTGVPIMNKVAALQSRNIMPQGSQLLKLVRELTLPVSAPLTSPRGASAITRGAGRLATSKLGGGLPTRLVTQGVSSSVGGQVPSKQ